MWGDLPFISCQPSSPSSPGRSCLRCLWRVETGTTLRELKPFYSQTRTRLRRPIGSLPCHFTTTTAIFPAMLKTPPTKTSTFISLDFVLLPIKPLTSIGSLIHSKTTTNPTNLLNLLVCNPFTRESKKLPILNAPRSNPAIGIIIPHDHQDASFPSFQVYVAGWMSGGGSTYEPTLEFYDSRHDTWRVIGSLPMEFLREADGLDAERRRLVRRCDVLDNFLPGIQRFLGWEMELKDALLLLRFLSEGKNCRKICK